VEALAATAWEAPTEALQRAIARTVALNVDPLLPFHPWRAAARTRPCERGTPPPPSSPVGPLAVHSELARRLVTAATSRYLLHVPTGLAAADGAAVIACGWVWRMSAADDEGSGSIGVGGTAAPRGLQVAAFTIHRDGFVAVRAAAAPLPWPARARTTAASGSDDGSEVWHEAITAPLAAIAAHVESRAAVAASAPPRVLPWDHIPHHTYDGALHAAVAVARAVLAHRPAAAPAVAAAPPPPSDVEPVAPSPPPPRLPRSAVDEALRRNAEVLARIDVALRA